jgi:hypothetical protein
MRGGKKATVAAAVAAGVMVLATAAGTASAAPGTTGPAATRVVIYAGSGDQTGGPEGQSRTGPWSVDAHPAVLYTSNDGTLVEDTALTGSIGACPKDCGYWWYKPHPLGVQLLKFYWDEPDGAHALSYNLVPVGSLASWAYLGNGTYTPLCMSWQTGNQPHYIGLHEIKAKDYIWQKIANPSDCPTVTVHA